jgi:8-oxo-dGTP diphosphatase
VAMTYELEFELKLKEGDKVIMDEIMAKALRAIREGGSIDEMARSLKVSPEQLRRSVVAMRGAKGKSLAIADGGILVLSEEGRKVLDAFEGQSQSVREQVAHRFRNPILTVDGIMAVEGQLVVVRRGKEPFKGALALPGGIVEYGETLEEAVVREFREETGLEARVAHLLSVRSEPDRDPRGHFVTVVFMMERTGGELKAGDDAEGVSLVPLDPLPDLAFDHVRIVKDFLAGRERRP